MLVSIIMPSYNKYPLNLYSLYALEKQNFDLTKMEVILIDDASTDETPLLKNFQPLYHFKYIRNKKKLGTASARNKGIKKAIGKIIIFLDSEMVVDPEYVNKHYRLHHRNTNLVVIGGKKRKLLSHLYPDFDAEQIKDVSQIVKKSQLVKDKLRNMTKKKVNYKNIEAMIMKLKKPVPLLTKEDIHVFDKLLPYLVPYKKNAGLLNYLRENFSTSPIAWMACGGNLSLRKDLVNNIGGYDEDFKGWGPEDAEFAYRLYKAGAKFFIDYELERFHQEHPKQQNKVSSDIKNWILFQDKHPDLAVCIRAFNLIKRNDYALMDNVMKEYLAVINNYPGEFQQFFNSIIILLQQIRILKLENKPIINLMQNSGIELDEERKKQIYKEREMIKSYGKFNNLISLFDFLSEK
jgi:GT2 family glycosyltransferase